METYERIATINLTLGEYELAKTASKKLLQVAWCYEDFFFETKAYHLLAMVYFYK
jgi:hypothetical protein